MWRFGRMIALVTLMLSIVFLSACTSSKQKEQAAAAQKQAEEQAAAQKKAEEQAKAEKQKFEDTMREASNRITLSYMNVAEVAGGVQGVLKLNQNGKIPAKDAINVALTVQEEGIAKVKQEKAEIDKNMATLKGYKETPTEFRVQFEALSQLYDNYVKFVKLATAPDIPYTYQEHEAEAKILINEGSYLSKAFNTLMPPKK